MSPGIAKPTSGIDIRLVPGPRDMRFAERYAYPAHALRMRTEPAIAPRLRHAIEDRAREEFRGGHLTAQRRVFVKIGVVQRRQCLAQRVERAADIDDNIVGRKCLAEKRDIDDEGRAMKFLRRTENLSGQAMGDHDVVTYFDGEHLSLQLIRYTMEQGAGLTKNLGQCLGKAIESCHFLDEHVQTWVGGEAQRQGQPPLMAPTRATRRGHGTDLRTTQG